MVATVAAELRVHVAHVAGPSHAVPLCLRPGVPASLAAQPGHPFDGGAAAAEAGSVAVVMAGTLLPPMWVVAYDRWCHRTLPCERVSKWSCLSEAGGTPPLGYPAGRVWCKWSCLSAAGGTPPLGYPAGRVV
jgi:hypothetical protein